MRMARYRKYLSVVVILAFLAAFAGTAFAVPANPSPLTIATISTQHSTPVLVAANNKNITVYITNTGTKYHRANCRYLRKSKIPISLEEAKAEGYTPCKVCKPPR